MTARLPPRVGRYEIKGELGRGKMGVVYEAHDTTLGRDIALKTIRLAESASDEERSGYEQRFMTEARVAARLSHPGLVVVHDVGRDPQTGLLYLAFERLHGQTLDERLAGGKALPWREAFRLAKRLADALHHAHAQGVIHRDIKPANIMVLPSGDPKIMDFGIAKAPASQLTRAGEIFGTPAFMSPEQCVGLAFVAGAWWLLRGGAREDSALATETAPTASPSPIHPVMPGVLPPSAAAAPADAPSRTPARPSPPVPPTPRASAPSSPPAGRPAPMASASAEARQPASKPSFLGLDFEHSLESGTIQLWVDGARVFQKELTSQATRKLLVVRKRKGTLNETLELRPGKHRVRVRVSWEDEERTGAISAPFEAGASRSLAIRLSGRGKTLSLEWR